MKYALQLVLLSAVLCAPARADEAQVEIGTRLVCETQEQIDRYIASYNGDAEAAINAVNATASGSTACGRATVAFVRGPRVETASHGDMAFTVVRILVLGVDTPRGIRPIQPAVGFTLFGVRELGV